MSAYERGSQNIDAQNKAYGGFVKATTVSTILVVALMAVLALTLL